MGLDGLAILLRKERCPANEPRYYRFDPSATLASQLFGKCVIEFPVLRVVRSTELAEYQLEELSEG